MIEQILKSKLNKKILVNTGFIVLTILLPQMFHLFGGTGAMFLPMHIPVILTGITLGPVFGLITGAVSPIISTCITGMPAVFPVMPIMVFQLAIIGLVSGILNNKKINSLLLIILIQATGFIGYAFVYEVIKTAFLPEIAPNLSAVNAYITGIPGITMQLLLVASVIEIAKRKAK